MPTNQIRSVRKRIKYGIFGKGGEWLAGITSSTSTLSVEKL
jgi:hypothetical protein